MPEAMSHFALRNPSIPDGVYGNWESLRAPGGSPLPPLPDACPACRDFVSQQHQALAQQLHVLEQISADIEAACSTAHEENRRHARVIIGVTLLLLCAQALAQILSWMAHHSWWHVSAVLVCLGIAGRIWWTSWRTTHAKTP